MQVLELKEQGFLMKEISARLGISLNTVKKRLKQAYRRLGADNALEALWKLRGPTGQLATESVSRFTLHASRS